jgi:pentalenolactone synthase
MAVSAITRVRTQVGDKAWLVLRYDLVKQLLADPRLGRSHPDPSRAPRISNSILFGGPMEAYETEQADHAQMRALLTPFFSARRMEELRPRVGTLIDRLLDAMAQLKPPVDLHEALSFPLPVLVICELLGVPDQDRETFRMWSTEMADLYDAARARAALDKLVAYMAALVEQKRAQPKDDVLSGLCAAIGGGQLADQHIAFLGAMLLFTGHETTVVRLDLGTLLLLTQPAQRRAVLNDSTLIVDAVEEILRASGTGSAGLTRYAHGDIDVEGVTIHAGDAVLLNNGAANHDANAFADPDRFDVRRQPNAHLAFGYGSRYCIGAPLARLELQEAFARLIPRFQHMRLVSSLEDLHSRDVLTGGIEHLWVAW